MKYPNAYVRDAVSRLIPRRALTTAILSGPIIGATLAFGVVAAQEANTVIIDNFTFTPKELTVPVGTTVKWVNHDDIPHTVMETNKSFRSKPLDTNDTFSFTFAAAGTFNYFCSLHPQMVGKVVVQ
jgi:plastocyanin